MKGKKAKLNRDDHDGRVDTPRGDEDGEHGERKRKEPHAGGTQSVGRVEKGEAAGRSTQQDVLASDEEMVPDPVQEDLAERNNCGKILCIECVNFMCHSSLKLDLGTRVNFITGQNGSGKSAVIAALQICLGMKAKSTQRGKNLSSLIKNGCSGDAVVRITIVNEGLCPFDPERYGDRITVERVLKRSGGGEFRTLSANRKVVSTRSSEVKRITQHFNMMISNPCCILDQETSKTFLRGSASDKYRIFTQATLLDQLRQFYDEEQEKRTEAQREFKETVKPLLEEKRRQRDEARKRVEDLEGISRLQEKLEMFKKQKVWRIVKEEGLKLGNFKNAAVAAEEKVHKYRDVYDKCLRDMNAAANHAESLQEDLRKKAVALEEVKESVKAQLHKVNIDKKALNQENAKLKLTSQSLSDAKRQLKKEQNQLRELSSGIKEEKEHERVHRLQEISEERASLESTVNELGRKIEECEKAEDSLDEEMQRLDRRRRLSTLDFERVKSQLQNLKNVAKDKNSRFGNNTSRILDLIQRNKDKFEREPLHIGLHTNLKDMKWWKPIEGNLDRVLRHFLVTSKRDFGQLRALCRDNGVECPRIVISRFLDRRHTLGAATAFYRDNGIETLESVLSISDDNVYNALVDTSSIERIALLETSTAARKLVFGNQGPPGCRCLDLQGDLYSLRRGMEYKKTAASWVRSRTQSSLFSTDTAREEIRLSQELQTTEQALDRLKMEYSDARKQVTAVEKQRRTHQTFLRKAQEAQTKLVREEASLREMETPTEAYSELEIKRDALSASIQRLKNQIEEQELLAAEQKARADEKAEAHSLLAEKLSRLKSLERRTYEEMKEVNDTHRSHTESLERNMQMKEKSKRRLETFQDDLSRKEAELKEFEVYVDDCRQGALEYTNNVEVDCGNRTLKQIEADINSTTREIELEGKRHCHEGDDLATLVTKARSEAEIRTQKYEMKSLEVKAMKDRLKKFYRSYEARERGWSSLKSACEKRVRGIFSHYLTHRNHAGDIEFDDENKAMKVNWTKQKDASVADSSQVQSDAGQLSGGEKSFTTLCLLVAMGEILDCPFRVMDEFDVFMDAANRRMSLNLLVDMATDSRSAYKQFIFITPHDISCIGDRPDVEKFELKPQQHFRERERESR